MVDTYQKSYFLCMIFINFLLNFIDICSADLKNMNLSKNFKFSNWSIFPIFEQNELIFLKILSTRRDLSFAHTNYN